MHTQIAKFLGPTWGPPGSYRTKMDPHVGPRNLAIWVYYWFDGSDGNASIQINVKTDACSWVKNSTTTHVHHLDVQSQNSEKHHWNALVYDRKRYCKNCISYLSFLYDLGSTLQMHLFLFAVWLNCNERVDTITSYWYHISFRLLFSLTNQSPTAAQTLVMFRDRVIASCIFIISK